MTVWALQLQPSCRRLKLHPLRVLLLRHLMLPRLLQELLRQLRVLQELLPYIDTKTRALYDYQDRRAFGKKCLMNTASAGKFSSDRSITQYAEEIWHIQPLKHKDSIKLF